MRACLFQFGEEILETWVIAKNVVVGIVLDPVAFAPSFCKDALQQIEGRFLLTELGAQTSRIDQSTHVVGIEFKRALRPCFRPAMQRKRKAKSAKSAGGGTQKEVLRAVEL
jgi:hypothetical protein